MSGCCRKRQCGTDQQLISWTHTRSCSAFGALAGLASGHQNMPQMVWQWLHFAYALATSQALVKASHVDGTARYSKAQQGTARMTTATCTPGWVHPATLHVCHGTYARSVQWTKNAPGGCCGQISVHMCQAANLQHASAL